MGGFVFYLQLFFFIAMHIVKVYSFKLKIGSMILTQLMGSHQLHIFLLLLLKVFFQDGFQSSLLLEHFHSSNGLFCIFSIAQLKLTILM